MCCLPRDADPEAERDNARIVFLQPNGRVAPDFYGPFLLFDPYLRDWELFDSTETDFKVH